MSMRWIYLSPHLDDAVLSAGGLIYEHTQAGLPVEIWTIVCGFPPPGELSPLAQVLHHQWGTSDGNMTVRLRRAEDERAAAIVGAKPVHFDVPDCIYRKGADGDPLYMDVFVQPHETETNLPAQMAEKIATNLEPDDVLVCQLSIGGHVDHILVRQAAELLGRPLLYAADIPYLFTHSEELEPFTAGMQKRVYSITEAGLKSWTEAVLAYPSQLSTIYDDTDKLLEDIRSYSQRYQGLPLWQIE